MDLIYDIVLHLLAAFGLISLPAWGVVLWQGLREIDQAEKSGLIATRAIDFMDGPHA